MKKSLSWFGIASAIVMISSCANQKHWTSDLGEDSPVTMGGVRVANESPGSQGPIADNSRLAINHRDVARRETLARERLARDAEARRRTQVTDNTYTRSSAPVVEAPIAKTEVKKPAKHKKHVAMARKPNRVARRMSHPATGALALMNREVALNELHHINQKEIAMANLAASRSGRDSVKSTASRIKADHQALETRVEEVAKARSVTLAKYTPATYEEVTMDKLEALDGANFDTAFAQVMKDGHKLTTAQLRILRNRVSDREVLALIDQALPKVRMHEEKSKNVLSSIKTDNDYSARR